MGYGKMEGENSDRNIAYMIERDAAQGPVYFQKWYGMNALRLPEQLPKLFMALTR